MIDKIFRSDRINKKLCIEEFLEMIKSIKVVFIFFLSSIVIEGVKKKSVIFFLKYKLKKNKDHIYSNQSAFKEKQSNYLFNPTLIFSTFKDNL